MANSKVNSYMTIIIQTYETRNVNISNVSISFQIPVMFFYSINYLCPLDLNIDYIFFKSINSKNDATFVQIDGSYFNI